MRPPVTHEVEMRSTILEIFPGAPERCLTCPALFNGAYRQLDGMSVINGGLSSELNGGNSLEDPGDEDTEEDQITDYNNPQLATDMVAEAAAQDAPIARALWQHCPNGAGRSDIHTERTLLSKKETYQVFCHSEIALGHFVSGQIVRVHSS